MKKGLRILSLAATMLLAAQAAAQKASSDPYIFFGDEDEYWSNAANWEGNAIPPNANADVLIDGICVLDQNATVSSLTVIEGMSLTIPDGQILTVSDRLENTLAAGLVIEEGGQLKMASTGVQATLKKLILPYTSQHNGWRLIASPLAGSTAMTAVANLLNNSNFDLYSFDGSEELEWRNYEKPESDWADLEAGRGYLYASEEGVTLEFAGELDNVGSKLSNGHIELAVNAGWNLLGNSFAIDLSLTDASGYPLPYYRMNEEGTEIVAADGYEPIKPMEGFFYYADADGTVYLTYTAPTKAVASSAASVDPPLLPEHGLTADQGAWGQTTGSEAKYDVKMKDGTTDAENWQAKAGDGALQALPLTGVTEGQTVTVTYSGRKKVKSLKAAKAKPLTLDVSTLQDGDVVTVEDGTTITGTNYGVQAVVQIADGATVTLDGASIYSKTGSALKCLGNATIIVKDGTMNYLNARDNFAGIQAGPAGTTLTIKGESGGTGTLYASGGYYAAGIGAGVGTTCGNITISGGAVTANGRFHAPGIGASDALFSEQSSICGNITIDGGTVNASGDTYAAGIGTGISYNAFVSQCGNITITTNVKSLRAEKGNNAPYSIGPGGKNGTFLGTCGTITIGGVSENPIETSPYVYAP